MTEDNDRMDRAKRIRRMREGDRADENAADQDEPGAEEAETVADGEGETAEEAVDAEGTDESTADEDEDSLAARVQEAASEEADEEGETESAEAAESDNEGAAEETPAEIAKKVEAAATAAAESDEAATDQTPEAEADDVAAPLPEMDELGEALDGTEAPAEVGGAPAGGGATAQAGGTATAAGGASAADAAGEAETEPQGGAAGPEVTDDAVKEEETRVLEFALEGEYYCLDIAYIEEIVKQETITRVPNTPEWVEGVVDLRGQITTILNPKVPIGKENTEPGDLIIVFDSEEFEDQGHIGWVVDDVRQVSPIVDSEVNEPPMDDAYIEGVIDRDDDEQFVIWTDPDLVLSEAKS